MAECLFMIPQVIICQHTSDTRGDVLYVDAAFSQTQSACPCERDGRRWTSSLSPQPFQMSFYRLIKNEEVQLFEKIRHGAFELAAIIYLFTLCVEYLRMSVSVSLSHFIEFVATSQNCKHFACLYSALLNFPSQITDKIPSTETLSWLKIHISTFFK